MRNLLISACLVLVLTSIAYAQARIATVSSTRANLRETPSQNGIVKQEVPIGSELRVLDNKGPWYVVRIADAVGWMHGNTFRLTSGSSEDSQSAAELPTYTPPEAPKRPARVISESSSGGSSSSAGRGYIRGPRGGCYYISGSGRKVYVDRSLCN